MCDTPLPNKKHINNGPTVLLIDDSTMRSTHVGTLMTPSLLAKARISYMLPTITKSLLSVSAICDEGVEVIFMNKEVRIICKGNLILKEKRDSNTGLWLVPIGSLSNPNK